MARKFCSLDIYMMKTEYKKNGDPAINNDEIGQSFIDMR